MTSINKTFPLISFVLIIIASCITTSNTIGDIPISDDTHTLHVGSRIHDPSNQLIIHCKYKDNRDLGEKKLVYGETLDYDFSINGSNNTSFSCQFKLGNDNDRTIDAFTFDVEGKACNETQNYYWKGLVDGLYFTCLDGFVGYKRCDWNPQVPCIAPFTNA